MRFLKAELIAVSRYGFCILALVLSTSQIAHSAEVIVVTDKGCKVLGQSPMGVRGFSWSGGCDSGYADGMGVLIIEATNGTYNDSYREMQRGLPIGVTLNTWGVRDLPPVQYAYAVYGPAGTYREGVSSSHEELQKLITNANRMYARVKPTQGVSQNQLMVALNAAKRDRNLQLASAISNDSDDKPRQIPSSTPENKNLTANTQFSKPPNELRSTGDLSCKAECFEFFQNNNGIFSSTDAVEKLRAQGPGPWCQAQMALKFTHSAKETQESIDYWEKQLVSDRYDQSVTATKALLKLDRCVLRAQNLSPPIGRVEIDVQRNKYYAVINIINNTKRTVRASLSIVDCVNVSICGPALQISLAPGMNAIQQLTPAFPSDGAWSFDTRLRTD